eukprot:TRINITY_DN6536_c1_g3_i1.p4 TRINITY_DN6536_c1_g3~~TRINITY_DN6536_c1_g3_i1.p4  ORF type:complete len:199 (+),score=-11.45 TRINITY_DN6536_c1_g3_i1:736-1332(+)
MLQYIYISNFCSFFFQSQHFQSIHNNLYCCIPFATFYIYQLKDKNERLKSMINNNFFRVKLMLIFFPVTNKYISIAIEVITLLLFIIITNLKNLKTNPILIFYYEFFFYYFVDEVEFTNYSQQQFITLMSMMNVKQKIVYNACMMQHAYRKNNDHREGFQVRKKIRKHNLSTQQFLYSICIVLQFQIFKYIFKKVQSH